MRYLTDLAIAEFGSLVRRDDDLHSDRDVLVLYPAGRYPNQLIWQMKHSGCSCAAYSWSRFQRLATTGSLFVKHLVDESRIISDPGSRLRDILSAFEVRSDYSSVFNEALRVFCLLESTPKSRTGLSWAADLAMVSFRAMAIPFLANRGIFAFGMTNILRELRRTTSITREDSERLSVLREFKATYRSGRLVSCSRNELLGTINIIDKCFDIGLQFCFASTQQIDERLIDNPCDEWYRGVRLLEASILSHFGRTALFSMPELRTIHQIVTSPQIYGWRMKHDRERVMAEFFSMFPGYNTKAA